MTIADPSLRRLPTFGDLSEHRSNNFDFLRYILAALVLWYHCYPLLYGIPSSRPYTLPLPAQIGGSAAVDFFFVISGFLVTGSWARRPEIKEFLFKRILRIYPAFLVVSVFCAVIAGPFGADDKGVYWHALSVPKFIGYALLLVGPYIPPVFLHVPYPNAVDGSFWTLRYEFECYLIVAILGRLGITRRRVIVLLLFGVFYALYIAQAFFHAPIFPNHDYHIVGNPASWARLIVYFLAGMTFYCYRDEIPYSRALWVSALVIVTIMDFLPCGWEPILPLCGTYLLFTIAFSLRVRLQNFARHGDFSYGVYLYAFPVQQMLIQTFGAHLNPWALLLIALPITTILAALSWRFVESPCLKLKRTAPRTPETPLHPASV